MKQNSVISELSAAALTQVRGARPGLAKAIKTKQALCRRPQEKFHFY